MGASYGIGELARQSGVKVANIRYYEEIGILPKPGRRDGGHRSYGNDDLGRLRFVKTCRDLGYSLDQVRALLTMSASAGMNCGDVRAFVAEQLETIRQRQRDLKSLELTFQQHIRDCDRTCHDGPAPDCSIFRAFTNGECC